jgi:hypothetical protein
MLDRAVAGSRERSVAAQASWLGRGFMACWCSPSRHTGGVRSVARPGNPSACRSHCHVLAPVEKHHHRKRKCVQHHRAMARPLHLALLFCHAASGSPDASFRVILDPQVRLPNETEALATASARRCCYIDRSLLLASVARLLVHIIQSAMQSIEFVLPSVF